ncbi:MAG: hypothetical protein GXO87_03120 [Chlorobi bacterium]|nr:hypothetical protein [Chlorobiota bacterium]
MERKNRRSAVSVQFYYLSLLTSYTNRQIPRLTTMQVSLRSERRNVFLFPSYVFPLFLLTFSPFDFISYLLPFPGHRKRTE